MLESIKQITNKIMMIRPANFGYNEETAPNNAFQISDGGENKELIAQKAQDEFDALVFMLENNGIEVIVIEDTPSPPKPDAVFPNNWISFHQDGSIMTYPMFSKVRRLERRKDIVDYFKDNFSVTKHYRFESYESDGMYLEGTGSMILDRPNKLVFACKSVRTNEDILDEFSRLTGYKKIIFQATDGQGQEIYHTNVMMAIGTSFVIICMDTVRDEGHKQLLRNTFATYDKEVIEISMEQMNSFAGNMLQVGKTEEDSFLVMSESAFNSLSEKQVSNIEKHAKIIHSPIPTIERYGGGSVRCMMAEVFLPERLKAKG